MLTLKPILALFFSTSVDYHVQNDDNNNNNKVQQKARKRTATKKGARFKKQKEENENISPSISATRSSVSISEAVSILSTTATATLPIHSDEALPMNDTNPEKLVKEVEFDQSRHLLELDFFKRKDVVLASFPQFDYLLKKSAVGGFEGADDDEKDCNKVNKKVRSKSTTRRFSKINDRFTMRTLRRKISIYNRENDIAADIASKKQQQRQLERSKSTPNLA